tara:strand:+ start:2884 stop:3564 length:681 start_codon:yes stop_codon:yes gene_type:complete
MIFVDNKFRKPRLWSNFELKKFADKFYGQVINVSGWNDSDKAGSLYKNYFLNCENYSISNWSYSQRGQERKLEKNQYMIDLEVDLDPGLFGKFEVVFNHTTLEHIFDINKSFKNLCKLSSDTVILVLPFIQEQHTTIDFEDYWRFTPQVIKKLFERNNFKLTYINANDSDNCSIYIFAIGCSNNSKNLNWIKDNKSNKLENIDNFLIGKKIIKNSFLKQIFLKILG